MNFLKFACSFALVVVLQFSLSAQDWTSHKSQQKINDLVDTGSELLMATDAGLVVMNKTTLEKTIFDKSNSSLSSDHIQTITRDAAGNIWIGTYDLQLALFNGTDFQDIMTPQGADPSTTLLFDLKIAPNGDFWLGTSAGVFHKQGQNWSLYDQDEFGFFFEVWDIEIDNDGVVYAAAANVHKFENGMWSNISDNTGLFAYAVADLFLGSAGDLYFFGGESRLGRYDGQQWQEYDISSVTISGFITELRLKFAEDTNGNIYFNTPKNGILKLVNDIWEQETAAQIEAFDNKTSYFHIDGEDNWWLSRNIHLSVNRNGTLESTLIGNTSIESNAIRKVRKASNGDMYFLTSSDYNISILETDGNWSSLSLPTTTIPFPAFTDLLILGVNDIWLTSSLGLYHYNGSEWTFNSLDYCKGLAMDSQGKIYAHTDDKIYIVDNGAITEYNTSNSPMPSLDITGHGVDANDNLWIAFSDYGGSEADIIQKVSADGNWTTYAETNYPAIEFPYGDFYFDNDGHVWIPAYDLGVIKFDGTNFTNPYLDNIGSITNTKVFSMEEDADGKLYFSNPRGVTTLQDGVWENLSIEEVPQNAVNTSAIQFDDEGDLWWASSFYGVFEYTPETTTSVFSDIETTIDFTIFPNPASTYTTLNFTIEEPANVHTFIYNHLGQVALSRDLGQLPAGDILQTIDIAHLPKGTYIIQVQIDKESSVKTIIIR